VFEEKDVSVAVYVEAMKIIETKWKEHPLESEIEIIPGFKSAMKMSKIKTEFSQSDQFRTLLISIFCIKNIYKDLAKDRLRTFMLGLKKDESYPKFDYSKSILLWSILMFSCSEDEVRIHLNESPKNFSNN
jgi:hypothetical protein